MRDPAGFPGWVWVSWTVALDPQEQRSTGSSPPERVRIDVHGPAARACGGAAARPHAGRDQMGRDGSVSWPGLTASARYANVTLASAGAQGDSCRRHAKGRSASHWITRAVPISPHQPRHRRCLPRRGWRRLLVFAAGRAGVPAAHWTLTSRPSFSPETL